MAITVDTLKFLDDLERAQVPREQARAIVQVVRESHDSADVSTKGDLRELELRLRNDMDVRFAKVDGELKTHRWMLGFVLTGVLALVLKAFF